MQNKFTKPTKQETKSFWPKKTYKRKKNKTVHFQRLKKKTSGRDSNPQTLGFKGKCITSKPSATCIKLRQRIQKRFELEKYHTTQERVATKPANHKQTTHRPIHFYTKIFRIE